MKKFMKIYGIGVVFFGILSDIGCTALIKNGIVDKIDTFTRLKVVALEAFLWPIALFNIITGNVNEDNVADSAKQFIDTVK